MTGFDPRDPDTYSLAAGKPLILDGVSIFKIMEDADGNEIKSPVTEKDFALTVGMLIKMQNFNNSESRQKYIDDYIKEELYQCSPKAIITENIFGGYEFSPAQLEILGGTSNETLTEIGKIMASGLHSGQKKQAIFNRLGIDGEYVVNLQYREPMLEERAMREYFTACDQFETLDEIHTFFDSSEYLKTHPDMKKEVVEIALQGLKDSQEWAKKHIVIRKGKSVKAIEKGQEIPQGWEIK